MPPVTAPMEDVPLTIAATNHEEPGYIEIAFYKIALLFYFALDPNLERNLSFSLSVLESASVIVLRQLSACLRSEEKL